jgi:hypothetical protein
MRQRRAEHRERVLGVTHASAPSRLPPYVHPGDGSSSTARLAQPIRFRSSSLPLTRAPTSAAV